MSRGYTLVNIGCLLYNGVMFESLIPQLMQEHNLTAYGLSKKAGITQDAARALREGETPTMFQLEKICEALDVDPGDVIRVKRSETVVA